MSIVKYLSTFLAVLTLFCGLQAFGEPKFVDYLPLENGAAFHYRGYFRGNTSESIRVMQSHTTEHGISGFHFTDPESGSEFSLMMSFAGFWGMGIIIRENDTLKIIPHDVSADTKPTPILPDKLEVGNHSVFMNGVGRPHVVSVVGFEAVTTPAGTFENCLKIRVAEVMTDNSQSSDVNSTYLWFAKNVGIVKQHYKTGRVDELASYRLDAGFDIVQGRFAPRFRDWVNEHGVSIHARFKDGSYHQGTVQLESQNGQTGIVTIESLSAIDEEQVKHYFMERGRNFFIHGQEYQFGENVGQSFSNAVELYRRSFQYGNIQSAFSLGLSYSQGTGVSKDDEKAREYYRFAASAGHTGAQVNLGLLLDLGRGGPANRDEAVFWYRKAAEKDNPTALNNLAVVESTRGNRVLAVDYFLRAAEIYIRSGDRSNTLRIVDRLIEIRANQEANEIRARIDSRDSPPATTPSRRESASMGTGWFISPRHVVTCQHVISGHENYSIRIRGAEAPVPLRLVVSDRQNDIAVLEIIPEDIRSDHVLRLATKNPSAGDRIFTIGFPHPDLMGFDPKFTEGSISSTSGIRDDPRTLQISAPVQSGNSGGPLVGADGAVVGLITSKLAAARIFEYTGDLPQNVNYAVKIPYLRLLLDTREIPYTSLPADTPVPERAESIRNTTNAIGIIIAE